MRQESFISPLLHQPSLLETRADSQVHIPAEQIPVAAVPSVDYQFLIHPEKISIYAGEQITPTAPSLQLPLLVHPTDAARFMKKLLVVHEAEAPASVTGWGRLQALDGINWVACDFVAYALPGTYKDLLGWHVVARQQQAAASPFASSDPFLRVLAHFYKAGQWHYYPQEATLQLDHNLLALLQLPNDQPVSIHSLLAQLLPEDRMPLLKQAFRLQRKGGFFQLQVRLKATAGAPLITVTLAGGAFPDEEGKFYLNGICFLQERQQGLLHPSPTLPHLDATLELGKIGCFEWTPALNKIECSPQLKKLLGLSVEDPLTLDVIKSLLYPAEYSQLKNGFHQLVSSEQEQELYVRLRPGAGRERSLWIKASMISNGQEPKALVGLVQDVSEGADRQVQLQAKDRLISSFLHHLPVSILAINKQEEVVSVVGHGLQQAGLDKRSIEGKPLNQWMPSLLPEIQEVLQGHSKSFTSEYTAATRSFTFFNHYYFDEKRQMAIGFTLDISQQKQAELTAQHVHQLEHRFQLMETFVHAVAHDLRSPVVNLDMLLKFFMDEPERSEQERYVVAMSNGIQHLKRTLDALIEILRIEKDISIAAEEVSFQEVLEELREEYGEQLTLAGGTIETFFQCPSIYYNKAYLSSILRNLISNAIKYTRPEAPPCITICSEKKGNVVLLLVQDNGIGIDLKKWGHLMFKPFKRLNSKKHGTGIGLHLIRQMIEKNGGKIKVKSQAGEGSSFFCFLRPYSD